MRNILCSLLLIFMFYGCGKGLSPEPEALPKQAGFGGTITFIGNWPPDAVRTHIVVFKNLLSAPGDFNILNLGFVSDSIPSGVKQITYSTLISPVVPLKYGEYSYIAVAQSKSPALSLERKDWYIIGIYSVQHDNVNPGKLIIPPDTFIPDINITCDFNNPPPQPPAGLMPE